MTWQIISVLLNLIIVSFMSKLMWDIRKSKQPSGGNLNLDAVSRVKVRKEPFAKPSGKSTPKVNDDAAAWKREKDPDLKDH